MTYLSIVEKLQILFKTLLDFKFILVFTILLLILTLLYVVKKISSKKYVLCMSLSFIIAFVISIIGNYNVLSNTFDNFTTILFGNIYFPSIYVYIGCLVISFIFFITSMLNVMLKKIYKIINSVMFVMNNILFIVILNIIARDSIDIFSITSLYSNTTLVVMLELSMGLFILWILSLATVYVTNCICERMTCKKTYNDVIEEKTFNSTLEVGINIDDLSSSDKDSSSIITPISENNVVQDEFEIEDNGETINISGIDNIVTDNVKDMRTFNDILNMEIPVTYYDNSIVDKEYELDDPYITYEKKYQSINKEKSIYETILNDDCCEKIELSVEERTLREKEKMKEERIISNTVSLNDLIDDKDDISSTEMALDMTMSDDNIIGSNIKYGYTVDDYKKILKMLEVIKLHSNSANINIDDAVAISLISNYSIDDCMKFKNILESNLN